MFRSKSSYAGQPANITRPVWQPSRKHVHGHNIFYGDQKITLLNIFIEDVAITYPTCYTRQPTRSIILLRCAWPVNLTHRNGSNSCLTLYNIGTAAQGSGENPFIIHSCKEVVSATHLQTVQCVAVFFSYLYVIQFQHICYRYFDTILYYDEVQFTHEKTNHGADVS